ncbi:unnamed protein product [Effrenium voratum]|uniref:SH3 domain-containing protein n=1 Tax=Effrenium voratum TaxID=2562239 RepID=A0AA36MKK9_9DINO|nr:unnamed protein product [Effrenium voratum]CAJ1451624.1 unnamed protein product [Effrenium voratum]
MEPVVAESDTGYLTVRPGDTVTVLYLGEEGEEKGWAFATLGQISGWLPSSALEPLPSAVVQEPEPEPAVVQVQRGYLPPMGGYLQLRRGERVVVMHREDEWLYGYSTEGLQEPGWFPDLVLTKPPLPDDDVEEEVEEEADAGLPKWAIVSKGAAGWQTVLCERGCFVGFMEKGLPVADAKAWQKKIVSSVDFEQPVGPLGPMGRGTKWLVAEGCSCCYRYGGHVVEPGIFEGWMLDLMRQVMPIFGIHEEKAWPTACNLNLYVGPDGLDWHADDESLMDTPDGSACIVSLSLGAD